MTAVEVTDEVRQFDRSLAAHLRAGPRLLAALDIDGTLLAPDGDVSAEVRDAVADLRASGTHVVLATGRSPAGVRPVLAALGIDRGWAVASNGAATVRLDPDLPGGGEITDVVTFDPEPALRLLKDLLPGGLFAVERQGEGFWVSEHFPPGELSEPVRVVDFEALCDAPATRVTIRAPHLDSSEMREIVERSGLAEVTYAVGWTAWLDLTPPGVTKASALELLRSRLAVPADSCLAVGDGHNDVDMLRWAGLGVAMGGSDAETVAAADAVTDSVEQDGLVPVLRSLLP